MASTVVATTTVAVAVTWLGDVAVTVAAVNLGDVAGSRRRRSVVARGLRIGAVGACGVVVVGCDHEPGGSGSELHGNIPNKRVTADEVPFRCHPVVLPTTPSVKVAWYKGRGYGNAGGYRRWLGMQLLFLLGHPCCINPWEVRVYGKPGRSYYGGAKARTSTSELEGLDTE